MLKVAIVDDDAYYLEILRGYITRYQEENNVSMEVTTFSSGLHLIVDYKPVFDILFFDIELPHMNGIEIAKYIREIDPYAIIVFITNLEQYAIRSYEVNAYDYMVKPIDYSLFSIRLQDIINAINNFKYRDILIATKDKSHRIKASEILFIEVRDHLLTVHTKQTEYQMFMPLKKIEHELENYSFVRCNKSFVINLRWVTRMRADRLVLQGKYTIKISRNRRKEVQDAFVEYYSNQL